MMASEYYKIKAMKWMYELIEAIPVDRSGRDMAATRAALRALGKGHVLGIFPEGKIAPNRELLPFQSGVAMLAIKTKVPVYPAFLDGTQRGQEHAAGNPDAERGHRWHSVRPWSSIASEYLAGSAGSGDRNDSSGCGNTQGDSRKTLFNTPLTVSPRARCHRRECSEGKVSKTIFFEVDKTLRSIHNIRATVDWFRKLQRR